jgi:hypothetical protein
MSEASSASNARPTIEKARLVDVLLVKIDATAHTEAASIAPHAVAFSASDIASATTKSIAMRDPLGSLLGSLLSRLDADVRLGPLALFTPRTVLDTLSGLLEKTAAPVDALLVNTLQAVGIRLGEGRHPRHRNALRPVCTRAVTVERAAIPLIENNFTAGICASLTLYRISEWGEPGFLRDGRNIMR